MPSYLHGRTIPSSDSSRHRAYHDIGGRGQFTSVDASHQRTKGQQNQQQSCRPSATPQKSGHDASDSIPLPPGHTYDDPTLRCPRCAHPFIHQTHLDRHSLVCGAAALLTGMLVPWSAQQNDHYQQTQLHLQAARDAGYYQSQYTSHNQNRRT